MAVYEWNIAFKLKMKSKNLKSKCLFTLFLLNFNSFGKWLLFYCSVKCDKNTIVLFVDWFWYVHQHLLSYNENFFKSSIHNGRRHFSVGYASAFHLQIYPSEIWQISWFLKTRKCYLFVYVTFFLSFFLSQYIYIYIYISLHHQVALTVRIFLLLSPHSLSFSRYPSSLSSIFHARSSKLHPVSVQNWCWKVLTGWPTLARLCVGVHRWTSLTGLSLLLQYVLLILLGCFWHGG